MYGRMRICTIIPHGRTAVQLYVRQYAVCTVRYSSTIPYGTCIRTTVRILHCKLSKTSRNVVEYIHTRVPHEHMMVHVLAMKYDLYLDVLFKT